MEVQTETSSDSSILVPAPLDLFTGFDSYFVRCFEVIRINGAMILVYSLILAIPNLFLLLWVSEPIIFELIRQAELMVFNSEVLLPIAVVWFFGYLGGQLTYALVASAIAARTEPPSASFEDAVIWPILRAPLIIFYAIISLVLVLVCLAAFVVPGIYLMLRLAPLTSVVLFEPGVNPIGRSWELTQGRALLAFFAFVGMFLTMSIPAIFSGIVSAFYIDSATVQLALHFFDSVYLVGIPPVFSLVLYCGLRVKTDYPDRDKRTY